MPSSLMELAISSSNDARPDETSFGLGLRLNTPLFANRYAQAQGWRKSPIAKAHLNMLYFLRCANWHNTFWHNTFQHNNEKKRGYHEPFQIWMHC